MLLPSVARMWGLDLGAARLANGRVAWDEMTGPVRAKRNRVVHEGEVATEADARTAIEVAECLLTDFVGPLAARFGLEWPERSWSVDIIERDGSVAWRHYMPQDPFERPERTSAADPHSLEP